MSHPDPIPSHASPPTFASLASTRDPPPPMHIVLTFCKQLSHATLEGISSLRTPRARASARPVVRII